MLFYYWASPGNSPIRRLCLIFHPCTQAGAHRTRRTVGKQLLLRHPGYLREIPVACSIIIIITCSPPVTVPGSIPVPRHGMAHPASCPITNINITKRTKRKLMLAKTSPSLQFVICRRFVKLIWALFRSAAASSQIFFSLSSHHFSYRCMG